MAAEPPYQPPIDPPTTYVPRVDLATRFNLPKKTTVLLHPRRAHVPDPFASKMGGTFAWPRPEPWPTCPDHGDIIVPILQLRKDHVPELIFPEGADLFQLLWCPEHHDDDYGPKTHVFWRSAAAVGDVLERSNPPVDSPSDECVPKECKLYPERVVETEQCPEGDTIEAIGEYLVQNAQHDFDQMNVPEDYRDEGAYQYLFSAAPSTKVAGWCSWVQDPYMPTCDCGRVMEHLLTVASGDVGDGASGYRWAPSDIGRDQRGFRQFQSHKGSDLCVGDVGSVYVGVCRHCEGMPTRCHMQCS